MEDGREDADISEGELDRKIETYRRKIYNGKKRRSSSENKHNDIKKKWKTAMVQSDDTTYEDGGEKHKTKFDKGVHGKSKPRGRSGSNFTVRCSLSELFNLIDNDLNELQKNELKRLGRPRVKYLDKKVMLSVLRADVIDKDRWGRLNWKSKEERSYYLEPANKKCAFHTEEPYADGHTGETLTKTQRLNICMNQYVDTLLEDEPGGDGISEHARDGDVYDEMMKKHIETRRKKLSAMADCFRASNECAVDVLNCLDRHGSDIRNIASGSSTGLAERTPVGSQPAEPEAHNVHHVGIVYMDRSRFMETSDEQQEDVSATGILAKSTIVHADMHTSAAGYSNGGVNNDPIGENRTAYQDNSGINVASIEVETTTDVDVDDVPANDNNTAIVMLGDAISRTEADTNVSDVEMSDGSKEDDVIQYDAASKIKELRMLIGKTDLSKARLAQVFMHVTFDGHITAYILNTYPKGGRVEVIDTRDYRTTPKGLSRSSYHNRFGESMLKRFNLLLAEMYPKNTMPSWGNIAPRAKYFKVHKGDQHAIGFRYLKCIENYDGKELVNDLKDVDSRAIMDEYLFWALFCPANKAKEELPTELKSYAPKPK
ncbi:hypothetical protein ACQ4PT_018887 [Festuca glaucescens]